MTEDEWRDEVTRRDEIIASLKELLTKQYPGELCLGIDCAIARQCIHPHSCRLRAELES
jgi:hypothetical protein